jgi:hypothetical protein
MPAGPLRIRRSPLGSATAKVGADVGAFTDLAFKDPYDPDTWSYGAYGSYKPGEATSGIPIDTPTLTLVDSVATAPPGTTWDNTLKRLTISATSSEYDALDVRGYIRYLPGASGGTHQLTRSRVTGGVYATATDAPRGLIVATHANATNVIVKDCDLHCWYTNDQGYDGVRGRGFTVERCDIKWVVDGLSSGHSGVANCHSKGNWVHDHAWVFPDQYHTTGTRGTHNDGWQIFGGTVNESVGDHFQGNLAPGGTVAPSGLLVGRQFEPQVGPGLNQYGTNDPDFVNDARPPGDQPYTPRDILEEVSNGAVQCGNEAGAGNTAVQFNKSWFFGGSFGQINIPTEVTWNWGSITQCRFGRNSRFSPTWTINTNGQTANGTLSANVYDDDGSPVTAR